MASETIIIFVFVFVIVFIISRFQRKRKEKERIKPSAEGDDGTVFKEECDHLGAQRRRENGLFIGLTAVISCREIADVLDCKASDARRIAAVFERPDPVKDALHLLRIVAEKVSILRRKITVPFVPPIFVTGQCLSLSIKT